VAEIEWKGAIWKAAFGDLSVKELLTILKGFGPMEILEFEKPGYFRGQMSVCLSPDGIKEITVYHIEVLGEKRCGQGREALRWLKKIFKGELYVEDPGFIRVKNANGESLLFWVKMFREGLIGSLDSELCCLHPDMDEEELNNLEARYRGPADEANLASGDK
jgi:hypothetical protein